MDGKHIYAHKLVLRIRSDYFKKLFASDWKEKVEERLISAFILTFYGNLSTTFIIFMFVHRTVFEVQDFSYEGFRTFLLYLYTERIEPPLQNVADAIGNHGIDTFRSEV